MYHLSCIIISWVILCIMCYVSHSMYHMPCHVSHVSHIMSHIPCITCHVMFHMSYFRCMSCHFSPSLSFYALHVRSCFTCYIMSCLICLSCHVSPCLTCHVSPCIMSYHVSHVMFQHVLHFMLCLTCHHGSHVRSCLICHVSPCFMSWISDRYKWIEPTGSKESFFLDCRFPVIMYLGLADQLSGTQQHESPGMNQYHEWPNEYSPFLSYMTWNWHFVWPSLLS